MRGILIALLVFAGYNIDGASANYNFTIGGRTNVNADQCAVGNGVVDDAPCINSLIAALPPTGGTVTLPCGKNYLVNETINIGNGTVLAYSTTSGVRLVSDCAAPPAQAYTGGALGLGYPAAPTFTWGGGAQAVVTGSIAPNSIVGTISGTTLTVNSIGSGTVLVGGVGQAIAGITNAFNATIAGNNLTITSVPNGNGLVGVGQTIAGSGVTAANIVSQTSGTPGGEGVYVISGSGQTISTAESMTATSTITNALIVSQISGAHGGVGTYQISVSQILSSATQLAASYGGLTVSGVTSGALAVGKVLTAAGMTPGITINGLGSGATGAGTYLVSLPQTLASTTITASPGPVISINGPLAGWALIGININCANLAGIGLNVRSAMFGQTDHLGVSNCEAVAIESQTWPAFPGLGNNDVDNFHNEFYTTSISVPEYANYPTLANNTVGIDLTSDPLGVGGTDYAQFHGLTMQLPSASTGVVGIHLAGDIGTNDFRNVHFPGTNNPSTTCVQFDYTLPDTRLGGTWAPNDTHFYNIDTGSPAFGGTCGTVWGNLGSSAPTQATYAAPNVIYQLDESNQSAWPQFVGNLINGLPRVYGSLATSNQQFGGGPYNLLAFQYGSNSVELVRATYYVQIATASGTSTVTSTLNWTDPIGNAQSNTTTPISCASTANYTSGTFIIYHNAAPANQIINFNNTISTAGACRFNVYWFAEKLN